jgi:hypothetical protein
MDRLRDYHAPRDNLGPRLEQARGGALFLAEPEKALCDRLAMIPHLTAARDMFAVLEDDLRMEQTGHWSADKTFDHSALKRLLTERFNTVDFDQARDDVRPFLREPDALALWSRAFFLGLVEQVNVE